MKAENNIKALEIYRNNWENAAIYDDAVLGRTYNVCIENIFPNLQNEEFDSVDENYIVSDKPIDVFVHPHHHKLIISDGHHRFASALRNNKKSMKCKIVECMSYNLYIPTELF
jgi:uncharacterized protein (DUF1015 family)